MPTIDVPARKGRPPVMDSDQRKEQILRAAEAVFADHGYADASIDLIARRAGMSRRTIYRFHSSKADLFAEIVLGSVPSWSDATIDPHEPFEDALVRLMTEIVERAYTPRHVRALQLTISEIHTSPELSEVFRRNSIDRGRQELSVQLSALFGSHGFFTDENFDQWSDILFGAVVATPILHALVGDWESHDARKIEIRVRRLARAIVALHASGDRLPPDESTFGGPA